MVKLGDIYRDTDGYFRTCSVLREQDRVFLCEQFGFDIDWNNDTVYVVCQRIHLHPSVSAGKVFVLTADELLTKTEIPLVCKDCLFSQTNEDQLRFCALACPLPIPHHDQNTLCAQFRSNDKPYELSELNPKQCIDLLEKTFRDFDVDHECITQNGKPVIVSGCVGGCMTQDEFHRFLAPYHDESICVITRYWDRESNSLHASPRCFSVPKQEFDYTCYRFLCDNMYTAFIFSASEQAVVIHTEGIYRFTLPYHERISK